MSSEDANHLGRRTLFKWFFILFTFVAVLVSLHYFVEYRKGAYQVRVKSFVKKHIHKNLTDEDWDKLFFFEGQSISVDYTFDHDLTKFVKKEIRRYRPDFVSAVIIDNNTGKVLTALDYGRKEKKFSRVLSFSSTHPSASIFKIITAANLIENAKMSQESRIPVNGKGTTLYKYQLKDRINKWTRRIPLIKAFALSHNPAFGKAIIQKSSPEGLYRMGMAFGFNKKFMKDIDLATSHLAFPKNEYNLAEISSGFNRETLMSPLHGASIASIVANNGILKRPYLIEKIKTIGGQKILYQGQDDERRVIDEHTALSLQEMMIKTVKRGTARSSFRKMKRPLKNLIDIGGKTGSITGEVPHGKRDWFVAWTRSKNDVNDKGISICVMIVNLKKWYVKSSYLSKRIIEYYYTRNKNILVSLNGGNKNGRTN